MQTLNSVLLRSRRRWELPRLHLSTEFVRGCISVLAGVVIWEILTRLFLEDELLIPPPSSVARSFWTLASNGQLSKHFVATLIEFAYGFSAACVVVTKGLGRRSLATPSGLAVESRKIAVAG